jgi:hypothetical protein
MPPAAAALLPHPPLLVPELAGGAAPELDPLRDACLLALAEVLAAGGTTILIGTGPAWAVPAPAATGSFQPYGAPVEVSLPALVGPPPTVPSNPESGPPDPGRPQDRRGGQGGSRGPGAPSGRAGLVGLPEPGRLDQLPLSMAVAAWLLAGVDARPGRLLAASVPASLGPGAAAAIGRALVVGAAADGPVGLVVMADLSACRTEGAPGALHPAAAGFDASVGEVFRTGQPARLLDLDPAQAADLLVGGRVPLQVLAGAFQDAAGVGGRVLYEDAPYGVGYLVGVLTTP